jgi:hypothetical protein
VASKGYWYSILYPDMYKYTHEGRGVVRIDLSLRPNNHLALNFNFLKNVI